MGYKQRLQNCTAFVNVVVEKFNEIRAGRSVARETWSRLGIRGDIVFTIGHGDKLSQLECLYKR